MIIVKWLGIILVSVIMGMVLAGLVQVAVPSLHEPARLAIEVIGALIILRPMIETVRIAATIEQYHGKQFQ